MLIKITGTTFRKNKCSPVIGDKVDLIKEDNEYDPLAVAVCWGCHFLGYLKKGSPEQKLYHEKPFTATIKDFAHSRGEDENGIKDWNNEGEGYLESVTLEACVEVPTSPAKEEVEVTPYYKDGKPYRRISQVLSELEHLWTTDEQRARLEDWKANNRDMFKMSARYGTIIHEMAEVQAQTRTGKIGEMMDKHDLLLEDTERTVYDDELGIAGTYDASFTITDDSEDLGHIYKTLIIDWKTSKAVQEKHKFQVAFYAHNAGAEEAWVVLVGKDNKQGYSISKVDVELYYNKFKEYLNET